MRVSAIVLLALASLAAPFPASAWSAAGHMITAAIAYDELVQDDGAVIDKVAEIIAQHPDRAVFELAADGTWGRQRALRLLMQCARWPDDARGTAFDHPTWHYASRPVMRPDAPSSGQPKAASGQAIEALELNLRVAANTRALGPERAVALCWVMHVAGDMHQPLHTGSLFSATYPEGDRGGNRQQVVDPATGESLNLHWYWDSRVQSAITPAAIAARAKQFQMAHPKGALTELERFNARDFRGWSFGETYPLLSAVYPEALAQGGTEAKPVALPEGYAEASGRIAERRVSIAGYRLADLLRVVAREREGNPE